VEGKQSSEYRRPVTSTDPARRGRVVGEFEVFERGIALRMRIERWPARPEAREDEPLAEAGYGHGV